MKKRVVENHLKFWQSCNQTPEGEHSSARALLLKVPCKLFVCTSITNKPSGLQLCFFLGGWWFHLLFYRRCLWEQNGAEFISSSWLTLLLTPAHFMACSKNTRTSGGFPLCPAIEKPPSRIENFASAFLHSRIFLFKAESIFRTPMSNSGVLGQMAQI